MGAACRHGCGRRANRPRGLCGRCYETPGVRALYPAGPREPDPGEMTDSELDALIAEQLRPENLPDWWPRTEAEHRREMRRERRGEV